MKMFNEKVKRPNFAPESKGTDINTLNDALNKLIINVKEEQVKEVLLKIKIDASYDKNSKAIGNGDVKQLQDTLDYLKKVEPQNDSPNSKELLKPGVIHEIIVTISRILPYRCNGCAVYVFF